MCGKKRTKFLKLEVVIEKGDLEILDVEVTSD
jgi:hypothetical protein